ncbi:MAG TPA: PIN domain-containing protein [Stellaceae bacterium]|jgi:predicted nucleic acid-binding protein|nr:PIN domain-containing protein [Stellaceae bacterium]
MPVGALLDTGPLVAYLYPRDAYHDWAVEQFEAATTPFITCEAVLTEACFLTFRNGQEPLRVIRLVSSGVVRIGLDVGEEITVIEAAMQRYANVPMSLADACLVRLAETRRLPICTLDSDFTIYRTRSGRAFDLVSPPGRGALHEP